ncbi:Uma2 family endonuclease [Gemmata sp.]|uniref:Uma2 family endonuclease n=1 Tax=Gemmata sp. TaxID=1914242 RepID=UPI003F7191E8
MILAKTTIGPRHHGRKMSLKAFEFARGEEGHLYELARGYVVVSEVPNYPHAALVAFIRNHLVRHQLDNPAAIHLVLEGGSSKLVIPDWESERHPDLAVYLTAPKGRKDRTLWRTWVPELVVEVVSEGSRDRDYTQKRDEFWTLGIKEYWIVDAKLQQVLVLRRGRSQWTEKTLGPADACETKLLPGFKLPCRAVFDAGGNGE